MQRLSVAQAAKILGVSEQAIYARVKRDTIRHEIGEDGQILVLVDSENASSQPIDQTIDNVLVNDYITALKSEIDTLKSHTESLERDRDEWKEEARRKDTIIAQVNQSLAVLINRVPELEASPEATESPVRASETQGRGEVPADAQNRSWWRRIFTPDG